MYPSVATEEQQSLVAIFYSSSSLSSTDDPFFEEEIKNNRQLWRGESEVRGEEGKMVSRSGREGESLSLLSFVSLSSPPLFTLLAASRL